MSPIVARRALDHRFTAIWNGKRIGAHRVSVKPSADGASMTVSTEIELAVRLGFITVFRYRHRSLEHWDDGRLHSIASRTEDDGAVYTVDGAMEADGFAIRGPRGQGTARGPLLTSNSLWTRAITREQEIIDAQWGHVLPLTIDAANGHALQSDAAEHFRFTTPEWSGSLWYDGETWVRAILSRKGHTITLDPDG
jgi:hypothetical protein